jgi:sn-glycerol 3-phosphate transport system substrate-binding protein
VRPQARGNPIPIDVWLQYYAGPEFLDPVRNLAREFERKHPDYSINIRGVHFHAMADEVREAAAGRGVAPTLAEYFCFLTQEARDARRADGAPLFTSAAAAIGGRAEILGEPVVLDDILPAARDYFSYGGELPSIPWMASTPLLFANATVLAAAGIGRLPGTWAEIEAACHAVASLRGGPAHGITWPNFGMFFQLAVAQQGGLLADHDNGRSGRAEKVDLASGEMMSYVRWWQRLHKAGHYLYTGTPADTSNTAKAFAEAIAAFGKQQTAFTISSSVDTGRLTQAADAGGFAIAACRVPHNDEVRYAGNLVGGDSFWLANGLDRRTQDGALAFLQFLNNPRNAADRHKEKAFCPITRASAALLAGEGWFAEHPIFQTATDIVGVGNDSPAARGALLPGFAGVHDVLSYAMHDVLTSSVNPDERFARATAEAQRLLDAYRQRHPPASTAQAGGG